MVDTVTDLEEKLQRLRELGEVPGFDSGFYLKKYPDVETSGFDPLEHYLRHGWLEGRSPSAGFNGNSYLAANPDVRESGMNPLLHFLFYGISEGRLLREQDPTQQTVAAPAQLQNLPGFDASYYTCYYPEVEQSGMLPLQHYLEFGWRRGYRPSKGFDGEAYLRENPDLVIAGVNPLLHFLEYGLSEGRNWASSEVPWESLSEEIIIREGDLSRLI